MPLQRHCSVFYKVTVMSKTKSPFQLQTSECHLCIPTSLIMNVKIVSFLKVSSFDLNDASYYQEDMRGHSHVSWPIGHILALS